MPPAETISAASQTKSPPTASRLSHMSWRVMVLSGLVLSLWIVTFAWQFVDLNSILSRLIQSESDAWLFALTLGPLLFLVMAFVSAWPVIIGMPTTLLLFRLALNRFNPKFRFWTAIVAMFAVFVGTPMILNREAHHREQAFFQSNDVVPPIPVKGRSVEIREVNPVAAAMVWPPRCDDRCILMLSFGGAKSITRSFPADANVSGSTGVKVSYILGPVGKECQDFTINFPGTAGLKKMREQGLCAVIVKRSAPTDQLVINVEGMRRTSDKQRLSVGRRLIVTDTLKPAEPPVVLTRFEMRKYPVFLNATWNNGKLILRRSEMPIAIQDELDQRLYRDAFFKR